MRKHIEYVLQNTELNNSLIFLQSGLFSTISSSFSPLAQIEHVLKMNLRIVSKSIGFRKIALTRKWKKTEIPPQSQTVKLCCRQYPEKFQKNPSTLVRRIHPGRCSQKRQFRYHLGLTKLPMRYLYESIIPKWF